MRIKKHRYRKPKTKHQSGEGLFMSLLLFFRPSNYKQWWWIPFVALVGIICILVIYSRFFLPSVSKDNSAELSFSESTVIYDRGALEEGADPNDHILYVIHGEENREYIPLDEISPWLKKATMAIEDDGFYRHFGFDVGGISKAFLHEIFGIGPKRGGSTITQQLAKNVYLSRERKLTRKFKELFLAIKLEIEYSKDEILELYLNKIPYGNNAHGAEAAAKTFFGKSARDLSIAESAILASLPVAPTRFSPFGSNQGLLLGFNDFDDESGKYTYKKGRKDLVLQRMLDLKMITFEEFKQAWAEAKSIEFTTYRTDIKAPHFVFRVREILENKFGKEFLRQGGLRIFTTLDRDIQDAAESIVQDKAQHYVDTYGAQNVALTVIDNENGQILGYIGGRDFFDESIDGQVDVLNSRRQPGSSFKPLVFASAFEQGFTPASVIFDVETDFGGNYRPQNFNGEFQGPVSLRTSLNESLNIPSVKMAHLAGPQKILDLATVLGIKYEGSSKMHGVAIGVGVAEIEPLSHINSFQAFAGDGTYYEPSFILEVQNSEGKVLEQFDITKKKHDGLDMEVAALVRNILTDESTRPTTDDFSWNKLLELGIYNNGVKTGTSNRVAENPEFDSTIPEDEDENPRMITVPGDSWTVGFTPHIVAGVWVGNNKGEPMKPGATGLAVAAPIWRKVMLASHDILIEKGADPKKEYNEPKPLVLRDVMKYSGKLATEDTPKELISTEVFASFSLPTEFDNSIVEMEIDRISGLPATEYTPLRAKTTKSVLQLTSILPDKSTWDGPAKNWISEHPKFMASLGQIMDDPDNPDEIALEGAEGELAQIDPSTGRPGRSRWDTRLLREQALLDDVHNEYTTQNAPTITITSPKKGAEVDRGQIEVRVNASARFGVKVVEFYLNDQLVDERTIAPFTGKITIPNSIAYGSQHVLEVVVVDTLLNTAEQKIDIKIEKDVSGPEIVFLGPVGGQRIPLNSTVDIMANVWDRSSGVKEVQFTIGDQVLPALFDGYYRSSFVAQGNLGEQYLIAEATDLHGNKSKKSIRVFYEREKLVQVDNPEIVLVTSFRASTALDIVFPNPELVEFAEVIITVDGEIAFYKKIETVSKFVQIQVPSDLGGSGKVQLLSKLKGLSSPYESPVRTINAR